jgi:DNA-binding NarL/FixJ family response regulator
MSARDASITVLIADPSEIARAGLRALLGADPHFAIVGETSHDVLELTRSQQPNLIILGTESGNEVGSLLIGELLKASPSSRIVVFAANHDPHEYLNVMLDGVRAYLLKGHASAESVTLALLAVGRHGMSVTDSEVVDDYLRDPMGYPLRLLQRPRQRLTAREHQVLTLLADGASDQQISKCLNVSVSTVATHVRNLSTKLGVTSRFALGMVAERQGLIPGSR